MDLFKSGVIFMSFDELLVYCNFNNSINIAFCDIKVQSKVFVTITSSFGVLTCLSCTLFDSFSYLPSSPSFPSLFSFKLPRDRVRTPLFALVYFDILVYIHFQIANKKKNYATKFVLILLLKTVGDGHNRDFLSEG